MSIPIQQILTLTAADWWTLLLTIAITAGILVLEHFAVGRRGWPYRYYYALGLVTTLGLILAWAALRQIAITPGTALVLLLAAGLAGGPDFLVLRYEDGQRARRAAEMRRAWEHLARQNRELACELALLQVVGDKRRYSRAHELMESILFLRGGIQQDLIDMQLMVDQLEPLLAGIINGKGGREND